MKRKRRSRAKKKESVLITTTKEEHKDLGRLTKIEFPNKSAIIVSKKGWHIKLSPKKELEKDVVIILTYPEIGIALGETIKLGYTNDGYR